jgi:hypothetical protein
MDTRNGKPLPERVDGPAVELKVAAIAFIAGGGLNLLAGMLFSRTNPGWYTRLLFIFGGTAPIVGVLIWRRSRTALRIGIVYFAFALSTFLLTLNSMTAGDLDFSGNLFNLANAIIFAVGVHKGFKVMGRSGKEEIRPI